VARILRGTEDAQEKEYLTDALGREATGFIERHRDAPFFLYLAFNAPHGPLEATPKYLERFTAIEDEKRRTYAAMVSAMDDAIGRVLATVRSAGLEENTLIVFLSDNGGPTAVNASSNLPLRGVKGEIREGGIRSPFFVQWKGKLPAGQTYDPMVISLDVAPTLLEAAGMDPPPTAKFDGASLLPYLTGKASTAPHDTLYWRFSFPPNRPERYKWAIRRGNWKLLTDIDGNRSQRDEDVTDGNLKLVDLSRDIAETHDLSQQRPEKRAELLAAWKKWNSDLPSPPAQRAKDANR
jgi:arylsulfatase A-like enzyme